MTKQTQTMQIEGTINVKDSLREEFLTMKGLKSLEYQCFADQMKCSFLNNKYLLEILLHLFLFITFLYK